MTAGNKILMIPLFITRKFVIQCNRWNSMKQCFEIGNAFFIVMDVNRKKKVDFLF